MHLLTTTQHSNLKFIAELPTGIGGPLSPKMDHLVCFLPGSIALGATKGLSLSKVRKAQGWSLKKEKEIKLARELMKTCYGMYKVTETGLAPEIVWFNAANDKLQPRPGMSRLPVTDSSKEKRAKDYIVKPLDAHNLQRPETVESLFMMWRITDDVVYREWGWEIFKSFEKYAKLADAGGYSSLDNVNKIPPTRRDNMESFWLVRFLLICPVVLDSVLHLLIIVVLMCFSCRPRLSSTFIFSFRLMSYYP